MSDTATPVFKMGREAVTAELGELEPKLAKALEEAGEDRDTSKIQSLEGDERSKSFQVATMARRINELGSRKDALDEADKAADRIARDEAIAKGEIPSPQGGMTNQPAEVKSVERQMAELFTSGEFQKGRTYELDISAADAKAWLKGESKTVMSTGAGWAPESIRTPGSTLAGREQNLLTSLIPIVPTSQAAYVFMRQTTRTNSAAEKAESSDGSLQSAAESAFAYTEVTETLRRFSHFLPVSDAQLEDVDGLTEELMMEMRAGVLERASSQIIVGTGTAPQIEGFLDAGRSDVNSVAKGSDDVFTALHNGITENRETGFAEPDAIVLHPSDWHGIRTTTTADGVFILGSPADSDVLRLWGLPVLVSTHETENTALLGAFARFSRFAMKGGIEVDISSEHASYFIQNVQAIRAQMRGTLAVLREDAFTKVTGL